MGLLGALCLATPGLAGTTSPAPLPCTTYNDDEWATCRLQLRLQAGEAATVQPDRELEPTSVNAWVVALRRHRSDVAIYQRERGAACSPSREAVWHHVRATVDSCALEFTVSNESGRAHLLDVMADGRLAGG